MDTHSRQFPAWLKGEVRFIYISDSYIKYVPDNRYLNYLFLFLKVDRRITNGVNLPEKICLYARGPSNVVKRYGGYCINGFRFNTIGFEERRQTQNSGVFCSFSQLSYASSKDLNPIQGEIYCYGQVEDIVEIFYGINNEVRHVMFKVRWSELKKAKDDYGYTLVNLNKEIYQTEKYMLAAHAKQCFYVKDIMKNDEWVVLKNPPRSYIHEAVSDEDHEDVILADETVAEFSLTQNNLVDEIALARPDVPAVICEPRRKIKKRVHGRVDKTIRTVLLSARTRSQANRTRSQSRASTSS